MPNATLRFNLPEEEGDFRSAVDGAKWYGVVMDMDEWLRQKCKYAESDKLTAGEARDALHSFIMDAGLVLE